MNMHAPIPGAPLNRAVVARRRTGVGCLIFALFPLAIAAAVFWFAFGGIVGAVVTVLALGALGGGYLWLAEEIEIALEGTRLVVLHRTPTSSQPRVSLDVPDVRLVVEVHVRVPSKHGGWQDTYELRFPEGAFRSSEHPREYAIVRDALHARGVRWEQRREA